MAALDFIKQDKQLYSPKAKPEIVNIPKMQYLMIEGTGKINDNAQFNKALKALYDVAEVIKTMPAHGQKPEGYHDFVVPPPEGLWHLREGVAPSDASDEDWRWKLMIRVPCFVTRPLLFQAADRLVIRKRDSIYRQVYLGCLDEGQAVQIMHRGSFELEPVSIGKMRSLADTFGYSFKDFHHEIYFKDPRWTGAKDLRTIIRQPIRTKKLLQARVIKKAPAIIMLFLAFDLAVKVL